MASSSIFKWTKEYLVELLSTGPDPAHPILTDELLINAMNKIDRKDFVPEDYKNKAYDDLEIPIGYNEKLSRPTLIAEMLATLKPKFGGKYLDLGTGTGYSAAILAFVAGNQGKVFSIERVQWIWEIARNNIKKYPDLRNIELLYRDGAKGLQGQAPFDGIHVAFSMDEVPEELKLQLNTNGGRLVCPLSDNNLKIIDRKGVDDFTEETVPGFFIEGVKLGMA